MRPARVMAIGKLFRRAREIVLQAPFLEDRSQKITMTDVREILSGRCKNEKHFTHNISIAKVGIFIILMNMIILV
jgi:hypothetical protein